MPTVGIIQPPPALTDNRVNNHKVYTFHGHPLEMIPLPFIMIFFFILESNIGLKDRLQKVSYSSRYAMGLFYKPGTVLDIPWKAKYFYDDPCIRFVALDNKKRGIGKLSSFRKSD